MSSKLIKKIEAEQRKLELDSFLAGIKALGFDSFQQKTVYTNYQWMKAVEYIRKETDTPRVQKVCQTARTAYLLSLEQAIQNLPRPLKLTDWTRAGKAMDRIFKQAYIKIRS